MQEFKGLVAVITGAASGIGRALALRCVAEGMKVVLADVDKSGLFELASELQSNGADYLSVPTDVSKADSVQTLAQQTLESFGRVDLLCNNAGVTSLPTLWECSLEEWKWTLDVNLWGVIHGIHFFVPIMMNQPDGGYIVNTASVAGLVSEPGLAPYKVAKHGVVSLSETLFHELAQRGSNVKVSVLCPGPVNTNIMDSSQRSRPIRQVPTADTDAAGGAESKLIE